MLVCLLPLLLSTVVSAQAVTGKIVSCSGWALNRLPELKSFLKDGEAEWYQGVEVQYVSGKSAVLSIFHDGEFQQDIKLTPLTSKELMHSLMEGYGFVKKSDEEIAKMKEAKSIKDEAERVEMEAHRERHLLHRKEMEERREAQRRLAAAAEL